MYYGDIQLQAMFKAWKYCSKGHLRCYDGQDMQNHPVRENKTTQKITI